MKRYKLAIFFIVIVILIVIPKYVDAMTIVLDPGHGGIDVGSISTDKTLYEKDANLKIAQYLRDFLQKYENVEVILTHEGPDGDAMGSALAVYNALKNIKNDINTYRTSLSIIFSPF